jgi:hypothetical protein
MRTLPAALAVCLLVTAVAATPALGGEETFAFAPFGTVHVYPPERKPEQVVPFVSGDGGWNLGLIPMARRLVAEGGQRAAL